MRARRSASTTTSRHARRDTLTSALTARQYEHLSVQERTARQAQGLSDRMSLVDRRDATCINQSRIAFRNQRMYICIPYPIPRARWRSSCIVHGAHAVRAHAPRAHRTHNTLRGETAQTHIDTHATARPSAHAPASGCGLELSDPTATRTAATQMAEHRAEMGRHADARKPKLH